MKGNQPPREGWKSKAVREITVSASVECPMIQVKVGKGSETSTWLVDSGAPETVLDSKSWKEMFPEVPLQPLPEDLRFKTADGSPLKVLGSFTTEFNFGEQCITARVYVCIGVTRTRLIGVNILSQFSKWGVDNKNRCFTLGDVQIPLVSAAGVPPHACEVQLYQDVKVPARCSQFIHAALPQRYQPSEFVFKPDERLYSRHKLCVPVCLVSNDYFDGTVLVKVTNPSDSEICVNKGTKVGKLVNNVDQYDLLVGGESSRGCNINNLAKTSVPEMEDLLRKEHPELYKLYRESTELLDDPQKVKLLEILCMYRGAFSVDDYDLGTTNIVKHRIVPKSNEVVYRRQYRHSEDQHKQIDEEVQKLLKCGVIKESMSPFNNPVLMVPKAEKGKWRFCLDCRYINDLTEDQYFPIPLISDAMDSLAGSCIYSLMDCSSGYFQVDLEEEASEMCAFSTRKGHFQYTKMPMGLRGSGMTFQKMITLLLSGMLHTEVLAYLDDCILFSKSVSQHMILLEEVLRRFKEANLKLKPRKCKLFKERILYLGYLVDKEGVKPNPAAVALIKDLEVPTSSQEVQRFLGKANYYRKFIPHLAEIAHPLYELTEKKRQDAFKWNAEHQQAFDQIKAILCSGQVMGHPRYDRDFILDVDASDYAVGAELSQVDDQGKLRPIYHASRHLEKSERNYSATARETLAAVFGCEYFRQYLQGRKFVLRSDHNPLVWLRAMKEPKRPYSGWIVRLEQFNYTIQYRPGKEHVNADFNSRVPQREEGSQRSMGTQTDGPKANQINQCVLQSTKNPGEDSDQMGQVPTEVKSVTEAMKRESTQPQDRVASIECIHEGVKTATEQEDIPSIKTLVDLQAADADIGPVIVRLQSRRVDNLLTRRGEQIWRVRKNLRLKEGLLIRLHKLRAGLADIEQLVLPECLLRLWHLRAYMIISSQATLGYDVPLHG